MTDHDLASKPEAYAGFLLELDGIKAEIRSAAMKKKGKTLPELVELILETLASHQIALRWDIISPTLVRNEQNYCYSAVMQFLFVKICDGNKVSCSSDWFVCGSGDTPENAVSTTMLAAKERFLLYYFNVPKKDLDPAEIIKKERYELEETRQKTMRGVLDKMHAKIRERVLADADTQKQVDDVVKGFVRINGKPSSNYYEIKTLETAEALSRAIDKLLG